MEQTRALNALEPFLALSKSANSPRAAADLITQATSAPNTYVFAELLQTPNIQNLRDAGEYAGYLSLLEIFAWGTWADYKANMSTLPQLTPAQHQKLLLLSLLPLAHAHQTLTYPSLLTHLDLPSPAALEQLLTTAIYSGLLTATLDPANARVHVTAIAPLRDLPPAAIPQLQTVLDAWELRCVEALGELEEKARAVKRGAVRRERQRRKVERAQHVVMEAGTGSGSGSGAKGKRGLGAMEVEEERGGKFAGMGRRLG
ncbi:uncharacterized protein EI97DRAFT_383531 [Westerdykella ornata]|uniref:PCI domain-containing protein n=1 Tax=Westerdykella ornata TaxID=318751 RepID=A0A6A6JBW7_WESOR|nr:uncharacterized protein EI97DRAFT_383531 [Westerdykella ornata]KAF2273488.1 hypothetical protein EI97DRAFT_383531 [Westerdykella ornata]